MANHQRDIDVPPRRPSVIRPDGTVPPGWAPVRVRVEAVCRTVGCENEGLAFVIETGTNADGRDRIRCGGCSTWMDDITDVPGKAVGRYRDGVKEA